MFITRLKLHNWRNFRDIDIDLQRRVFIVGANATGKSNLLRALLFLRGIASGGGLRHAGRYHRPPLARVSLLRTRSLTAPPEDDIVSICVEVAEEPGAAPVWSYDLALRESEQQAHLRFAGDSAAVEFERVMHKGRVVLDRPDEDDRRDPQRLTQTALEQVHANSEFRALADFLASIDYCDPSPHMFRMASFASPDERPSRSLAEIILATPPEVRDQRLEWVVRSLRTVVPHFADLQIGIDEPIGTPYLQARFDHWQDSEAWQSDSELSDGTLRLIALLWATQEDHAGPLLIEEPETSLHDGAVRVLAGVFAGVAMKRRRQVFVTTQAPTLLSDDAISLREIALLQYTEDGTSVSFASDEEQLCALVGAGHPRGEAVIPWVGPRAPRLSLY